MIEDYQPWIRLIRQRGLSRQQKREALNLSDSDIAGQNAHRPDIARPNIAGHSSDVPRYDSRKSDHILSSAKLYVANEVSGKAGLELPDIYFKPCADKNIEKEVERDLKWLEPANHHLLTFDDARYPSCLKQIYDPPLALYAIGDISLLNDPQVAIVGSRKPTPVGAHCAERISGQLAELGICITSGLAIGIDGIAHASALKNEGRSIAVMANGLDRLYPQRHSSLFSKLCERGLVLSEYPLGLAANKYRFPERNRIVSGLSLGVVIVEAAERSGTLITARLAGEQNRHLMVVPGSALSRQYQGSHRLLQAGASLVSTGEDVLACLSNELSTYLQNLKTSSKKAIDSNSHSETKQNSEHSAILSVIGAESTSTDDIIRASGRPVDEVASALLDLELSGCIASTTEGGFVNLT